MVRAFRSLSVSDPLVDRRITFLEMAIVLGQGFWLTWLTLLQKQIPILSMGQGLGLAGWLTLFALLCAHFWVRRGALALFIYGISALLWTFALYNGIQPESSWLKEFSWIFSIHTLAILTGSSFCFLTSLFGLSYLFLLYHLKKKKFGLLYHRLPPLHTLEQMDSIASALACFFFAVGTFCGILLNQKIYHSFWKWDIKQVSSFLVLVLLASRLGVHFLGKKRGKILAQFSVLSGLFLLLSIFLISLTSGKSLS